MVIKTNAAALTGSPLPPHLPRLLAITLAGLLSRSKTTPARDRAIHETASILFHDRISRTAAAHDDIHNAIAFSRSQNECLLLVASSLSRMSELCGLALDTRTPARKRTTHNSEFLRLCAHITSIARTSTNGTRLFSNASQVIAIDEDSGTFLTSDLSLEAPPYTTLTASVITTTDHATTSMERIRDAISQLARDQARVEANLAILTSASEDLEVRQQNLSATHPPNSPRTPGPPRTSPYQVLLEAGAAMLTQVSRVPDATLRLPN